jgi:hypothetical protein
MNQYDEPGWTQALRHWAIFSVAMDSTPPFDRRDAASFDHRREDLPDEETGTGRSFADS